MEQNLPEETHPAKKKRREHSLPFVIIQVFLAFLVFLLVIFIQALFTRSLQVMVDSIVSFDQTLTMLQKAEERTEAVLDQYYEKRIQTLHFAVQLYNEGLYAEDYKAFRTIMDESYYVFDPYGHMLEICREGLSEEQIAKYETMLKEYYSEGHHYAETDFGTDVFFNRLEDGNIIAAFVEPEQKNLLVSNLYNTSDVVNFTEKAGSFSLIERDGILEGVPDRYRDSQDLPSKTELVPVSSVRVHQGYKAYLAAFHSELFLVLESPVENTGLTMYYLMNLETVMEKEIMQFAVQNLVIFALVFIIMFYVYECRKYNSIENEEVKKELRFRAGTLILISAAAVFGVSIFSRSLVRLSNYVLDDRQELMGVQEIYQRSVENQNSMTRAFTILNEEKAEIIGRYLSMFPEARTEARLATISDQFGFEYMILFDTAGNEVLSDSDYIHLSLSKNQEDLSFRFRSLLNGTLVISSGIEKDDLTGLEHQLIGVGMRTRDNQPDGALLCANYGKAIRSSLSASSISQILDSAASAAGNEFFIIDRETGNVEYSRTNYHIGRPASEIGFTETSLSDEYSGSLTIGGEKYFASQMLIEDKILFVALPYDYIYGDRGLYALFIAVLSFFLFLFSERRAETIRIPKKKAEEEEKTELSYYGISEANQKWMIATMKISRAVFLIFQILGAALAVVLLFRKHFIPETSIIYYVMDNRWHRGMNLFALTAVLIMVLLVSVAAGLIRYLLSSLSRVVSAQAETYLRLLISTVDYLSVILTAYSAMIMLGADMTALITTSSAMALLIGMGAEDLTKDIIAGLFLLFESEFRVGDVIEVSGKTGIVRELGLRTTKLIDENNNVILLNNSDVKNLINRTSNPSIIFTLFHVSADVPIRSLERIFESELPKLSKAYPGFLKEPYFKGVSAFEGGLLKCEIAAQVREEDRTELGTVLNQEVHRILFENGIEMQ